MNKNHLRFIKKNKYRREIANFTQNLIKNTIISASSFLLTNKVVEVIVGNYDVFLSVGGFVAGLCDLAYDEELNNIVYSF